VSTTVEQFPGTVETIESELAAARLARGGATGQIKGNMTRQIKRLELELAQAQESQGYHDEGEPDEPPAEQPKPKPTPKAKFDSARLVEIIEKAGEPMTVQAIADASGYEPTGSLTNRLVWLAHRDHLLREVEARVEVEGKTRKVRAFTRA
jgi:hypothetical protein